MRAQTRLARGPGHGFNRRVIFGRILNGGKMHIGIRRKHGAEPGHQSLVDAVELIRALRQNPRFQLLLEPQPLKRRAFIQRGRRIGVIFQHLGRTRAVIRQIEPAV